MLANLGEDKHTEMEYSIPAERGPDCIRALRKLIGRDFKDLAWPIEYRNLATDDVWLSTAYQRPTDPAASWIQFIRAGGIGGECAMRTTPKAVFSTIRCSAFAAEVFLEEAVVDR